MAIVTQPTLFVPGTPVPFTLNVADLLAHPTVAGSSEYSNDANWKQVSIKMLSTESDQKDYLNYDFVNEVAPYIANFETSLAATNVFEVQYLIIYGLSGGSLLIPREDLTVADFDIAVNYAPTAVDLAIVGTTEIGETVTLSYTYVDTEGDTESGTTFQWFLSDDAIGTNKTAIVGETSTTYTIVSGDLDKYLSFEVTPVADFGTNPGDPVESPRSGPLGFPDISSDGIIDPAWGSTTSTGAFLPQNVSASGNLLLSDSLGQIYAITGQGNSYDSNINSTDDVTYPVVSGELFRFNSDGTIDPAFSTAAAPAVFIGSVAPEAYKLNTPGTHILVGGSFTDYNGTAVNRLAKIDKDTGVMDATFLSNIGTGFTGGQSLVRTIIPLAAGGMLVFDGFDTFNGNSRPKEFIKLDDNGIEDTSFHDNLPANFLGRTFGNTGIAERPDGKIVVTGSFATPQLIMLLNADGTEDTSFSTNFNNSSIPARINDTDDSAGNPVALANNQVFVYNGFSKVNYRLNADGTEDTAFTAALGTANTGTSDIQVVLVEPSGKMFIQGPRSWNGTPVPSGSLRLNADGTLDTAFVTSMGDGFRTDTGGFAVPNSICFSGLDSRLIMTVRTYAYLPDIPDIYQTGTSNVYAGIFKFN